MGKKSKRRPAKAEEKKKEQRKANAKGAPPPPPGAPTGGAANPRHTIELLEQTRLVSFGSRYCGDGSQWTIHDDALLGDTEYGPYDAAYGEETDEEIAAARALADGPDGALWSALDELWADGSLSNPHGAGLAMGPRSEWMGCWAKEMAGVPERVRLFAGEHERDREMHRSTLEGLAADGRSNLDFVLASNCILQDTFVRVEVDPPPPLNLHQAMSIRMQQGEGKSLDRIRLEVWKGYKKLVLEFVKAVERHAGIPSSPSSCAPEVYPLKDRGEFPPASSRLKVDEGESASGGACGFTGAEVEELLAQGVKPWDDDAHEVLAVLNGRYDY